MIRKIFTWFLKKQHWKISKQIIKLNFAFVLTTKKKITQTLTIFEQWKYKTSHLCTQNTKTFQKNNRWVLYVVKIWKRKLWTITTNKKFKSFVINFFIKLWEFEHWISLQSGQESVLQIGYQNFCLFLQHQLDTKMMNQFLMHQEGV